MDDKNTSSNTNGNKIQIWSRNGSGAQSVTVTAAGPLQILGKCVDITGAGTANGTLVGLWDCNSGANQQWKTQKRHTGQPGVWPLPRRSGRQHHRRNAARDLGLQRRHQPEVDGAVSHDRPTGA